MRSPDSQVRTAEAETPSPPAHRQALRDVSDDGSSSFSSQTLLVTDLVDSTALVESLGDVQANELLSRHDRMARDLIEQFHGIEIDKSDGFLLLFQDASEAVRYALAYHQELAALSREAGVTLRARAGIHAGQVILRENSRHDVARGAKPIEVEGLAKPKAARVAALAGGGQTLLTREAMQPARREMETVSDSDTWAELRWVSHGAYPVKGITEAVEIYEVGIPGVAPLEAPPDSLKTRYRRFALLSVAVLALILLAAEFLRSRPGRGVVARPSIAILGFKNLSANEPATAWLSTALAELLASELAAGEELRLIPGENVERMRRELALLEIDTFARDTLAGIRRNLGTDYVVLGSYVVHPDEHGRDILRLRPVLQDTTDGEMVASLNLTGGEADLFDIVSQAGSLLREKLGVGELSATELRQVQATISSVPEATRLYAEGLAKLRRYNTQAARDVLEAAVAADPTYALAHAALSEAWLTLGYDKKALASARRAFDLARGLPREEELLIQGLYYEAAFEWQKAIETYRVLWGFFPDEVDYGVRLAEAEINSGRPREALVTVESLHELPAPMGDDPRIELTEATAAKALADSERELAAAERAIVKAQEREARFMVAMGHNRRGMALSVLGETKRASEDFEQALRLFAESGDRGRHARMLNSLAIHRKYQGDLSAAEDLYRQALAIHQETGNRKWVSTIQNNLAALIQEKGELESAKNMLEEALEIVRKIGDPISEAYRLGSLGSVLLDLGDLSAAQDMALAAQAVDQAIGNQSGLAWSFYLLGKISFAGGSIADARTHYEKALAMSEKIGAKKMTADVLKALAELLIAAGDLDGAGERLEDSHAIFSELGERGSIAETQVTRAVLALELGQAHEAAEQARRAATEFAREERRDDQLAAAATLARAMLAQGRLKEAREPFTTARDAAKTSQNPALRLAVAMTGARLDAAAGDHDAAGRELNRVLSEAVRLDLIGLALEIRWTRGEISMTTSGADAARAALAALEQEAEEKGFALIAGKARSLRTDSGLSVLFEAGGTSDVVVDKRRARLPLSAFEEGDTQLISVFSTGPAQSAGHFELHLYDFHRGRQACLLALYPHVGNRLTVLRKA